ncbi:MAG: hypothetical protein KH112_15610 [Sanguibacteroides justesenii]|nr:hypothetical protein [Sanguibacteroides justesenii]
MEKHYFPAVVHASTFTSDREKNSADRRWMMNLPEIVATVARMRIR